MYKPPRHFMRPRKKCAEKIYDVKLTASEIDSLIKLLEFSLMEILRTTKKFGEADFDLKDIYWNYRYDSNQIRKKLKDIKDKN